MSQETRAVLNGLDLRYAKRLTDALNVHLANLNLLYIKLHNFHWNVVGVDFFDFHDKTQELYEAIAEKFDGVAERIRMLGEFPLASTQEYVRVATLKEAPSQAYTTPTIAVSIVSDFAETARYLREVEKIVQETNDDVTMGMIGDCLAFLEKNVWFFSAYLGKLDTNGQV